MTGCEESRRGGKLCVALLSAYERFTRFTESSLKFGVIGGLPGRHFEVPLWSVDDDKKIISRGCPLSILYRNSIDVDRFRACQKAFSPYVNARGSFPVSQRLLEDCQRGRLWTTRLHARNGRSLRGR